MIFAYQPGTDTDQRPSSKDKTMATNLYTLELEFNTASTQNPDGSYPLTANLCDDSASPRTCTSFGPSQTFVPGDMLRVWVYNKTAGATTTSHTVVYALMSLFLKSAPYSTLLSPFAAATSSSEFLPKTIFTQTVQPTFETLVGSNGPLWKFHDDYLTFREPAPGAIWDFQLMTTLVVATASGSTITSYTFYQDPEVMVDDS